jgi:hypothetical protein
MQIELIDGSTNTLKRQSEEFVFNYARDNSMSLDRQQWLIEKSPFHRTGDTCIIRYKYRLNGGDASGPHYFYDGVSQSVGPWDDFARSIFSLIEFTTYDRYLSP